MILEWPWAAGWSHLLRESGRYPLTGHGDINTYAIFAETARIIIAARGRSGLVLPTGIATDATTATFFANLVATKSLVSVYDFENEEKLFKDVNNRPRLCLFTIAGSSTDIRTIELAFRARQVRQIEAKRFTLTPEDISLLNPNTLTCPVFDGPRHAVIVTGIYKRVPVLLREHPQENPWGLSFMTMFHMANDSRLFHKREELEADGWHLIGNVFVRAGARMLPLYEAKMIHHFDSRFSTYDGATQAQINKGTLPRLTPRQHDDPLRVPMPRYWIQESDTLNEQKSKPGKPVYDHGVRSKLGAKHWEHDWLLGWRDICRSTDERTMICGTLPSRNRAHVSDRALIC